MNDDENLNPWLSNDHTKRLKCSGPKVVKKSCSTEHEIPTAQKTNLQKKLCLKLKLSDVA